MHCHRFARNNEDRVVTIIEVDNGHKLLTVLALRGAAHQLKFVWFPCPRSNAIGNTPVEIGLELIVLCLFVHGPPVLVRGCYYALKPPYTQAARVANGLVLLHLMNHYCDLCLARCNSFQSSAEITSRTMLTGFSFSFKTLRSRSSIYLVLDQ